MTIEYNPNRFLRISDNLVTQDLTPPKLGIIFEGINKEHIKIIFPLGIYKTGLIEKIEKTRDYYKGGHSDYNIIVEYLDEVFVKNKQLKTKYEEQIKHFEELKQSLLKEAFEARLVKE